MEPIRILIADDHKLFREGLRALLLSLPDPKFAVVGEAADGEEAIVMASWHQPDVILMDVEMPGLDGIEATRRICEANSSIGVVVLTMHRSDNVVFDAMRAGARGYMLKTADHGEMVKVICAVASGEAHFGPEIAKRLMRFFSEPEPTSPHASPDLSDHEHEILDLIAQGGSDIAGGSPRGPEAIRDHVTSILAKLQAAERAQAMARARETELGDDD